MSTPLSIVIPLQPEEIHRDLICAICLSLPIDPCVVKSCSHVFCKECITCSLNYQRKKGQSRTCPICQCHCKKKSDVVPLATSNPLAHRIWANIRVKCQFHTIGCDWTGNLSEYQSHRQSCPRVSHQNDQNVIQSQKKEIAELKSQVCRMKETIQALTIQNSQQKIPFQRRSRRGQSNGTSKEAKTAVRKSSKRKRS